MGCLNKGTDKTRLDGRGRQGGTIAREECWQLTIALGLSMADEDDQPWAWPWLLVVSLPKL